MKFILFLFLSFTALGGTIRQEFEIELKAIQAKTSIRMSREYSTAGMTNVSYLEYKELDQLLNKYYKILLSQLNPSQKKDLIEAQREWIKFRDKEFKFYKSFYGEKDGTMWRVVLSANSNQFLIDRIYTIVELIDINEDYYDVFY